MHSFTLRFIIVKVLILYIFCHVGCSACYVIGGRAVANVGRTCSPTPLFVLFMYRGNKICLYYTCYQVNWIKIVSGLVEGKKILYFDVISRFYA